MKALELHQMEQIEGGNNCDEAELFLATGSLIFGVASAFGPIGLAIAGPTSLVLAIGALACAIE